MDTKQSNTTTEDLRNTLEKLNWRPCAKVKSGATLATIKVRRGSFPGMQGEWGDFVLELCKGPSGPIYLQMLDRLGEPKRAVRLVDDNGISFRATSTHIKRICQAAVTADEWEYIGETPMYLDFFGRKGDWSYQPELQEEH